MNAKKYTRILNCFALGLVASLAAPLLHAFEIGLQAKSTGLWVCAENGGGQEVVANRPSMGPWETFYVTDLNGGMFQHGDVIALQASNGRYVCAAGGGGQAVVADRFGLGAWEMFTIHRAAGAGVVTSGDTVWLEVDNGQYWSVISGGANPIYANKSSVGPMEEFIITLAANPAHYPPPPDAFVWIDHDNDGTRDKIIKSGSTLFTVSVDNWYTSCYDYWWYPINDYFDPWGYTWGSYWDSTPGFSRIWLPDLFWWYNSIYSYCQTDVEITAKFETEAGHRYSLYEDTSGSTSYNPSNWTPIFTNAIFGDGQQIYSLGWYDADYVHSSQYFLIRHGGPPSGVAPENDYSWHWEELPNYPADRVWDGVTIEQDFPQWNFQNWPDSWFMASPDDDDPELDAYFGAGLVARQRYDEAQRLRRIQRLQNIGNIGKIARATAWTIAASVLFDVWLSEELDRESDGRLVSYVVYEKLHPQTNAVYTGRTKGIGDAHTVMTLRDQKHKILEGLNYNSATMNAYITVMGGRKKIDLYAWSAMRGREQQIMDYHGGAILDRGGVNVPGYGGRMRASNIIRGVAKSNPNSLSYWLTSTAAFSQEIWEHTGNQMSGVIAPPDGQIFAGPVGDYPIFYPN